MPNRKRNRKTRSRREREALGVRSCARWFLRAATPLLRRTRLPRTRSTEHLRNATIEVLEAMRVLLDETIAWLRETKTHELRRIRVVG